MTKWPFLTQEYQTCEFNKLGVTKFCPYEVLERINDNSHMLKLPSHINTIHVFNVIHLTPYH